MKVRFLQGAWDMSERPLYGGRSLSFRGTERRQLTAVGRQRSDNDHVADWCWGIDGGDCRSDSVMGPFSDSCTVAGVV
ncbi:MAG TPA: hypothetical protein VII02_11615 [Gemmatimonadaceae bacterium]